LNIDILFIAVTAPNANPRQGKGVGDRVAWFACCGSTALWIRATTLQIVTTA
jgi:hypothetical protein